MSAYARDPILTPVSIIDLRSTQISVGMHEVQEKRRRLRKRGAKKIGNFLGDHMIPVILGPKKRHYVIDHHHLALSLQEEGIKNVLVTVVADLSELDPDDFWLVLDHHSWVRPTRMAAAAIFRKSPNRLTGSRTIHFAALPASCAGPAALPRIRPLSANFCGRTSCAGA